QFQNNAAPQPQEPDIEEIKNSEPAELEGNTLASDLPGENVKDTEADTSNEDLLAIRLKMEKLENKVEKQDAEILELKAKNKNSEGQVNSKNLSIIQYIAWCDPIESLFSCVKPNDYGAGYESTFLEKFPNDSESIYHDDKSIKNGVEDPKKSLVEAMIKALEGKLELEVSIPRKLHDEWEPTIKTKIKNYEYNALCDLGARFCGARNRTDANAEQNTEKKGKPSSCDEYIQDMKAASGTKQSDGSESRNLPILLFHEEEEDEVEGDDKNGCE
ncbi:hypothetical protein ZWY2020_034062, partial [Hordeum vulgare]